MKKSRPSTAFLDRLEFAELHNHLGAAASAAVLWSLAHEQGIKLPTRDYWKFEELVTITKTGRGGVTALDKEKYHWTELIQSSPLAMEPVTHRAIGGAYRASKIVCHEVRLNPMKRNRGGERDLDYIILATIRGMEQALLEYPQVRAGLIFTLDRGFTFRQNEIIYRKALKYQSRGVVGLDVAGPQVKKFKMHEYRDLFRDAKRHGLGVTIHTGEEGNMDEIRYVVDKIEPNRIGHGFMANADKKLMGTIKEKGIVLELCPTSNINIGTIKGITKMRQIYRRLLDAGVKLTVNTDGSEMHRTTLQQEFSLLLENNIFSEQEIKQIVENAFDATFIRDGHL